MNRLVISILTFMFSFSVFAISDEDKRFLEIVDSEWQRSIDENPLFASYMGDKSSNQDWPDISESALRERQQKTLKALEDVRKLNPEKLSKENRLNHRLFVYNYERSVRGHEFDSHLLVFGQRGGIQLEHETAESLGFMTKQDYIDWIVRLEKLPNYIDQHIELARLGMQRDITAPRILMERVARQIELQLVDDPKDSPFFNVFKIIPGTIDDKTAIQKRALQVISEAIIPAYSKFRDFFVDEYLPASRTSIGVADLPNGKAWYENLAKYHTSTELTPEEIHQIGLSEVKRIRSEMERVMDDVDWEGSFDEFLDFLRTDPQFYFETPEELLQAYLATSKEIDPKIVPLFKVLPRMPYGIKPIPAESAPDTTTAYYMRPAADGSRPGYYYVNLYKPEVRPKYEIEVLSVHEAVPGHHLQIALAMEIENIPNFRKYSGYTAYIEGWGLYSESLGYDMGLYQDPYSEFGALTYDMWRAVRLVVDTGMHYKGWSREKAIEFFKENAAKTEQDIVNEIDRYLVMPGQALAYKIGQLKIMELKNRSKEILNDKFDIKEFHHVILGEGALPLDILEEKIDEYIQNTQ